MAGGLRGNLAPPEASHAFLVEPIELLEEGGMPEITGVVVGERDDAEVPGEHVEDPGVGPERVGLVDRFANRGHDAFEIRDRDVDGFKNIGEIGEWIPARRDRFARKAVEHDVAGEGERHLVRRGALQRHANRGHQHDQAQRQARELQ